MSINSYKNAISSRLRIKSTLAVILLISIISGIRTSFFILRQKNLLIKEHRTRIQALGENLVNNVIDIVLRNDHTTNTLWNGIVRIEEDITDAFITNNEGLITDHRQANIGGTRITIPATIDTISENNWFPTDEKNKLRLFLPIEVKKETYDSTIHTFGNCVFPYFTHDSQEVTFSTKDVDTGLFITVSINIESKKVRRIFDKGI